MMINNQGNVCQPPPENRRTLWAWTIATFFGAGFGKPGPGTWGSVATVLLWFAYAKLLHPAPQTLLSPSSSPSPSRFSSASPPPPSSPANPAATTLNS
jgi:hypothetical protein